MFKPRFSFRTFLLICLLLGAFGLPWTWNEFRKRSVARDEYLASIAGKVCFSSGRQSWKSVIERLAADAGLHAQVDLFPPGTVRFPDAGRYYTPDEAVERINEFWLQRGYTLIRRGSLLAIIDINGSSIPETAPIVVLSELDQHADSMRALALFDGVPITAELRSHVEECLGDDEQVWFLAEAGQVVVKATIAKIRYLKEDVLPTK